MLLFYEISLLKDFWKVFYFFKMYYIINSKEEEREVYKKRYNATTTDIEEVEKETREGVQTSIEENTRINTERGDN